MTSIILTLIACSGGDTDIKRILPDIAIGAEEIDFGEVIINQTEEEKFQIINAGPGILRISEMIVVDNSDSIYQITPTEAEIAATEKIDVTISFTPNDYSDFNRTLQITSNDEETPVSTLPIKGLGGDGPQPDIAIDLLDLDFGDVEYGQDKTLYFTLSNEGDADLTIGQTLQEGAGAFQIIGDLDNAVLSAGVSSSILVIYTPTPNGTGDSGTLTIPSNDPDEDESLLVVNFTGNGGGDYPYPQAVIDCPTEVLAPTDVTLDGSASSDSLEQELTYEWTIIEKPMGSAAEAIALPGVPFTSTVDVDLAGDYQINLVVTNEDLISSAPAECLFYAEPPSDIHVELSWDAPDADLDLHFLRDSSGIFQSDNDCCWCSPNPDWGTSGEEENPILTLDSEGNYEPEAIDIVTAPDGEYFVRAHYFSDRGAGQTEATVRIYLNGVLKEQYSQPMRHNQVWEIGYIRWPEAFFIEENTTPYAYEGVRSCH